VKRRIAKVVQVAYHRNGVGGEGFHAVVFEIVPELSSRYYTRSKARQTLVASVFEGRGQVAIFNVAKLSDPTIGVAFGENAWRGDLYEKELRAAIRKTTSDGSVKVGPFGIPVERELKKIVRKLRKAHP
jgi:hypothetical protein